MFAIGRANMAYMVDMACMLMFPTLLCTVTHRMCSMLHIGEHLLSISHTVQYSEQDCSSNSIPLCAASV